MAQVNINESRRPPYADEPPVVNTSVTHAGIPANTPAYDTTAQARTAATNNLTWAIALVLIIAAVAIAIVFLAHSL